MSRRRSIRNILIALRSIPTLFLAASLFAGPSLVNAASSAIPPGTQSYNDRPAIESVTPRAHPDLPSPWNSLLAAHVEAIAQIAELYPTEEIYFLARDSELLYDTARVVGQNDPAFLRRLHLINVSRTNMRAPHILDYLAQEGISTQTLQAGRRVLFVDTGFSGTIPRVLSGLFDETFRPQLQTHLICSANPHHPSTRVFLQHLNPASASSSPSGMHATIIAYEHLPRHTHRSDRFVQIGGRWHAISPLTDGELEADGQVNPITAQRYQEHLAHYLSLPSTRTSLAARRSFWRQLRDLYIGGSRNDLLGFLRQRVLSQGPQTASSQIGGANSEHGRDPWSEGAARDFVEWTQTNGAAQVPSATVPLQVQELGLVEVQGSLSNKNHLIHAFPQWAPILENPQTQIPLLLSQGNLETLGSIIDVINDFEFFSILTKALGNHLSNPQIRLLVRALIEKGQEDLQLKLAHSTFTNPQAAEYPDLLLFFIEHATQTAVVAFAGTVFSSAPFIRHGSLLRVLIEQGNLATLDRLAASVFSRPESAQHHELIRLLIQSGHPSVLATLAVQTFPAEHVAEDPELIRFFIEHCDSEALSRLAEHAFSIPHMARWPELLRLLFERADYGTLDKIDRYIASSYHYRGSEYQWLRNQLPGRLAAAREKYFAGFRAHSESHSSHPSTPTGQPAPNSAAEIHAGQPLVPGNRVRTTGGRVLEVIAFVAAGKRGRVYRVRDLQGNEYALKVAIDANSETLASLAAESGKTQQWAAHHLAHAHLIEQGTAYVLREWIQGIRADDWVRQWQSNGSPADDPALIALRHIIHQTAERGVYVGDLNSKNLIWDGSRWVIVDSGSIRDGLPADEALSRFLENIPNRWARSTKCGTDTLRQLLRSLLQ